MILSPPISTLFPYTTLFRSFVEFQIKCFRITVLRVLDEEHHKEGDNGCSGIDNELPGHAKRSEEHTSELQSRENLVCRLLLEKKKNKKKTYKSQLSRQQTTH